MKLLLNFQRVKTISSFFHFIAVVDKTLDYQDKN